MPDDSEAETDPVLVRRERIRTLASAAQRIAYLLLGIAMVVFFVGVFTSFGDGIVAAIVVPLLAGCAILAVAIQVGYAIRGAERHEEEAVQQRRRR